VYTLYAYKALKKSWFEMAFPLFRKTSWITSNENGFIVEDYRLKIKWHVMINKTFSKTNIRKLRRRWFAHQKFCMKSYIWYIYTNQGKRRKFSKEKYADCRYFSHRREDTTNISFKTGQITLHMINLIENTMT